MATQFLRWNNDELVRFSAKLTSIHKAASPNAIRSTLNDSAVNMYKGGILKGARKEMTVRKPSVFKAYSRFNKASGWDINSMESSAGMIDKAGNGKFGTGIAKQEFGGSVNNKAYIAHSDARTGKGLVKKNGKAVLNSSKKPVVFKGERMRKKNAVTSAYDAFTQNRALLWKTEGEGILYTVKSFNNKRKLKFELKKIASYEKGRSVKIKSRRKFITVAAMLENKKMAGYFRSNAEFQIRKFMK